MRRRERFMRAVGQFVALWGLGVLLAGAALNDLLVGAATALLGTAAAEVVRLHLEVNARFRLRWIGQMVLLPGEILSNTWVVFGVLAGQILLRRSAGSSLQRSAFATSGSAAEVAGRKALAIIYGTTSPNFIAVQFEDEDHGPSRLLSHQLVERPVSASMRHLGIAP